MTTYLKMTAFAGALAFTVSQVSAAQINGSVQFGATKTIKTTPKLFNGVAAVTVDFKLGPNAIVGDSSAVTGDFISILGSPAYDVTFLDFTTGGAAVPSLWSIIGGPSFEPAQALVVLRMR